MKDIRVIVHIDLNAFFVRCEEIKNPSLISKPVIIAHKGRGGIVSTCSYEARKYGIHSGMPTFKAEELCDNLIIVPGDHDYYSLKSQEFFNFVSRYTSKIEKASIDECYVDMTDILKNQKDIVAFFKNFQADLTEMTGLTCSIGVSTTKFLAKMASDLEKPNGLIIIRKKDIEKILYPLDIASFYGIGKKTSPILKEMGITTIGEFAKRLNNDDEDLKRIFGKAFYVFKDDINGRSSNVVDPLPFDPKSIGNSHTLDKDYEDYFDLIPFLEDLSLEVTNRAKKAKKVGINVQITLKDNEFKSITRSKKLKEYTSNYIDIKSAAIDLLKANIPDKPIRLVGVSLQNLKNENDENKQLSIFDDFSKIEEENKTFLLVNDLNRKMNKKVFKTLKEKIEDDKYCY